MRTTRAIHLLSAIVFGIAACSGPEAGAPSIDESGATSGEEVTFARIFYEDGPQLQQMFQELDILEEGDPRAGWVSVLLYGEQHLELSAQGYNIEITRQETITPRSSDELNGTSVPGYACYRTVEETHAAMN